MNKKHLTIRLTISSFVALFLLSCGQKDVDKQSLGLQHANMRSRPRQLLETTQHGLDIKKIKYNSEEKVESMHARNGQQLHINYQPTQVIYIFSTGKHIDLTVEYKLAKGAVTERKETHYTSGGNKDHELVTTYAYEAGQLAAESYVEDGQPDGQTEFFYNTDGDLEHSERYNAQHVLVGKKAFTYTKYPDHAGFISQFDARMDAHLFPQKSARLLAIQTEYTNGTVKTHHFSYKLDASGYVEKGEIKTTASPKSVTVASWQNIWK